MKINKGEEGINAYQRLSGQEPNLESLQQFGQMCYVQIPQEIRRKYDFKIQKGKLGRIIGQDENVSGWIVRMEDTGNVVRTRDIRMAGGVPVIPSPLPEPPRPIVNNNPLPSRRGQSNQCQLHVLWEQGELCLKFLPLLLHLFQCPHVHQVRFP